MKMKNLLLLACGFGLGLAPAASAQSPEEPARAFVSVGGGYQMASNPVNMQGSFTLYDEPGSYAGSYEVGKGGFFQIGGGAHVFGQFSAGIAYSRYSKSSSVPLSVSVPHPLYYSQPRTVSTTVNDIGHTEGVLHLQLFYQLFSSSQYDASVSVGPSIFTVKEDSVKDISATETGSPYTTVNLNTTVTSTSKTTVGFNIAFNVNYHLTGGLDAGGFVQYTGATAKMPWGDVKAGGPQIGASVRYRF